MLGIATQCASSGEGVGVSSREASHAGARPASLLAVRLSPADVGRRVTVRHRLEDGALTDVVGTLLAWSGGWSGRLVVERRDGTRVALAATSAVAARVVPPQLSAEALQAVAELGWPPDERAELGGWTLRASGGVTGRANSVRVAGRPGLPLDAALEQVARWYRDRRLPPLLQVPVPSAYDDLLAAHGWVAARRTVLRTASAAQLRRAAAAAPGVVTVRTTTPSAQWLAHVEPDLDPDALTRILLRPAGVVFVDARDASTGLLLGTGRASPAASAVGRWAGVTSILTAPTARRRGVARTVMGELAAWAEENRCPHCYLQAPASTGPAAALCDALGLVAHHTYEYLAPSVPAAPAGDTPGTVARARPAHPPGSDL